MSRNAEQGWRHLERLAKGSNAVKTNSLSQRSDVMATNSDAMTVEDYQQLLHSYIKRHAPRPVPPLSSPMWAQKALTALSRTPRSFAEIPEKERTFQRSFDKANEILTYIRRCLILARTPQDKRVVVMSTSSKCPSCVSSTPRSAVFPAQIAEHLLSCTAGNLTFFLEA